MHVFKSWQKNCFFSNLVFQDHIGQNAELFRRKVNFSTFQGLKIDIRISGLLRNHTKLKALTPVEENYPLILA